MSKVSPEPPNYTFDPEQAFGGLCDCVSKKGLRWRPERPGKEHTDLVLDYFGALGKEQAGLTCWIGGWMVDFAWWWGEPGTEGFKQAVLVGECEWQKTGKERLEDFDKILAMDSPFKVFVCTSAAEQYKVRKAFRQVSAAVASYSGRKDCVILAAVLTCPRAEAPKGALCTAHGLAFLPGQPEPKELGPRDCVPLATLG